MSRGISGGKKVIQFANDDNFSLAKCPVRVSTRFTSILLAVWHLRRAVNAPRLQRDYR